MLRSITWFRSVWAVASLVASTQRGPLAQRPDPLAHLVAEALRNNLGLAGERLAERRSATAVSAARGLFFPALTLDSRYSEQNGTLNLGDFVNPAYRALNGLRGTNDFPTNLDLTLLLAHETRLRVTQPLFNESIRNAYRVAGHRHAGQRAQRRAAARRLAADVQIAYLEEASARRVVEILEATLTLVRENERVAERLLAAGRATPEAVHRARAERADVEQQLAEARERRLAAGRALNRLLRRPLEAPVEVIPDSAFDLLLDLSADSLVAHAVAAREEPRQVDAGVRTAEAARRAATAAFLPSLAVALDYGFQGSDLRFGRDDDYWVASLVVSWNLFNGGRNAARRGAAHLRAGAAPLRRRRRQPHRVRGRAHRPDVGRGEPPAHRLPLRHSLGRPRARRRAPRPRLLTRGADL